ncbi:MAG TPA: hypothetical protein VKE70_15130 [Candidatus Solibacter sp.]|nr:hypothetical protein [Candidatus Solibacter sp.]
MRALPLCSPQGGKCAFACKFSEPGLNGPAGEICDFWATRTTGMPSDGNFFADCPANGCIGLAFTMPAGFAGDKGYTASGGASLAKPYPASSPWDVGLKPVDNPCGLLNTMRR